MLFFHEARRQPFNTLTRNLIGHFYKLCTILCLKYDFFSKSIYLFLQMMCKIMYLTFKMCWSSNSGAQHEAWLHQSSDVRDPMMFCINIIKPAMTHPNVQCFKMLQNNAWHLRTTKEDTAILVINEFGRVSQKKWLQKTIGIIRKKSHRGLFWYFP